MQKIYVDTNPKPDLVTDLNDLPSYNQTPIDHENLDYDWMTKQWNVTQFLAYWFYWISFKNR